MKKSFSKDDNGFRQWLVDHPSGYVLNKSGSQFYIHRVKCRSIQEYKTRNPTKESVKVCSDSVDELLAESTRSGQLTIRCTRCFDDAMVSETSSSNEVSPNHGDNGPNITVNVSQHQNQVDNQVADHPASEQRSHSKIWAAVIMGACTVVAAFIGVPVLWNATTDNSNPNVEQESESAIQQEVKRPIIPLKRNPFSYKAFQQAMRDSFLGGTIDQRDTFRATNTNTIVEWECYVVKVLADQLNPTERGYWVESEMDSSNKVRATCFLAVDAKLHDLSVGQRITVSGVITRIDAGGIMLGECRVTRIE